MEEKRLLINKLSLQNGLVLAAISIVISLTMHFINPVMMFTAWWAGILVMILFIILMIFMGLNIRKAIGGYWTFGEAFKSFLVMSLILTIANVLFNIVLMKVIDPDLPQKAAVAIEEMQRSMLAKFGMSAEQIDTELAKAGNMEEKLEVSFKNVITNLGVSIAIWGVVSLILAAILKKNPVVKIDNFQTEG